MKTLVLNALALQMVFSPALSYGGIQPAEPVPPATPVQLKNVELSSEGSLQGQFVTSTGLSVSDAEIRISIGKVQHQVSCDAQGRFEVKNLRSGRCVIHAGSEIFACQVWSNGTAPPDAISTIAIVASPTSEVRGNRFWPPPYVPLPAKLAAISAKQAAIAGLAVVGVTVGIIAIADDDDAS